MLGGSGWLHWQTKRPAHHLPRGGQGEILDVWHPVHCIGQNEDVHDHKQHSDWLAVLVFTMHSTVADQRIIIYLFIYWMLWSYSPVNHTGSPQGIWLVSWSYDQKRRGKNKFEWIRKAETSLVSRCSMQSYILIYSRLRKGEDLLTALGSHQVGPSFLHHTKGAKACCWKLATYTIFRTTADYFQAFEKTHHTVTTNTITCKK